MRQTLLGLMVRQGLGAVLYWLGQGMLPLGRLGRAVGRPLLAAVVWLEPNHQQARAYYDYLQALRIFPQGQTEEALKLLRRAHRAVPDDETLHLDWAVALTMANHYERAIDVLEQLRSSDQARTELQFWTALGWSYLRTGRFPAAEAAAKQASEHDVASSELRLIRSLALAAEDGWVNKDGIAEVVNKQPRTLGMLLEFAYYLASIGKREQTQDLLAALPADIEPRSWRIIARHSLNADDVETAQWSLQKLSQLTPDSVDGLMMGCEIALRRGRMTEAVDKAHRAASEKPDELEVLETAGRVMVLAGQREEAFRYMTSALAEGSRDALAGGVVALYMLAQDRLDDARSVFSVQRSGDELACLYAHTATAAVLKTEDDLAEAVVLAGKAWGFWEEMPQWARTEAVRQHIVSCLMEIAEAAADTDDKPASQDAEQLLCRLREVASAPDTR